MELYAEKVNNKVLCSISQAKSLRYIVLGGLAMVYWDLSWKAGQRDVIVRWLSVENLGHNMRSPWNSRMEYDFFWSASQWIYQLCVRHVLLRQGVYQGQDNAWLGSQQEDSPQNSLTWSGHTPHSQGGRTLQIASSGNKYWGPPGGIKLHGSYSNEPVIHITLLSWISEFCCCLLPILGTRNCNGFFFLLFFFFFFCGRFQSLNYS